MKSWRLASGGRYLVSGEPVIVSDLTEAITTSIAVLLIAVVVVMALALVAGLPRTPAPAAARARAARGCADIRRCSTSPAAA